MSLKKHEIPTQESEVTKFYAGKSIFMTGASGFVGVVLLETLLRCCPGINKIYILLRSLKGVQAEERRKEILSRDIFWKLREGNPSALDKVIAVPGDVSEEDLGISDYHRQRIIQDVSIVFHCAASIAFFKPLSFMIYNNVLGSDNVLQLCKRLNKCEVLVYTSTIFSNSNYTEIEEKVYKLHFEIEDFVQLARNRNETAMEEIYAKYEPPFPNPYAFSKSVSESLLAERSDGIPVCIIRPSIVICCVKGAMPGYVENGASFVRFAVGIGKGFIRVARFDNIDQIAEQVPADVVANAHVVAAYHQAALSLPSPMVYNCTAKDVLTYTWSEYIDIFFKMIVKTPIPSSIQKPKLSICHDALTYKLLTIWEHYIPALFFDFGLWISGHKFRLNRVYKLYDMCEKSFHDFQTANYIYHSDNFRSLYERLNSTDTEIFPIVLKDFSVQKIADCIRTGASFYRKKDGQRINYVRFHLLPYLNWCILIVSTLLVYLFISYIWR